MKGDSDVSIVTLTHGKISQNVKRNGNDCSAVHTSKELQYRKDNLINLECEAIVARNINQSYHITCK